MKQLLINLFNSKSTLKNKTLAILAQDRKSIKPTINSKNKPDLYIWYIRTLNSVKR